MIGFQEYLKSKGFSDCRQVFKNKKLEFVSHSECGINENSFSTMVVGGLDIRYIKDDIQIVWGLNECGKPPTLIHPRPNIINSKDNIIYHPITDDLMIRALNKFSNDEIFEAMFNKNITLEL